MSRYVQIGLVHLILLITLGGCLGVSSANSTPTPAPTRAPTVSVSAQATGTVPSVTRSPTLDLSGAPPQPKPALQTGDRTGSVQVDGRLRTYRAHVPQAINLTDALPLLIVLRSEDITGDVIPASQLDQLAEQSEFIILYPDSIGGAQGWTSADVNFIRALIETARSTWVTDPRRTHVVGVSTGATLAHLLGIELSDQIASIAAIAGALPAQTHAPTQPVSVMVIYGTADTQISFERVNASMTFWTQANACPETAQRQTSGNTVLASYTGCKNGTAIDAYAITGATHSISSRLDDPRTRQSVSVSQLVVNFLLQHSKR